MRVQGNTLAGDATIPRKSKGTQRLNLMVPTPQSNGTSSANNVLFAKEGHRPPDHPIHKALASLSAGGPLKIRTDRTPWEMATSEGVTVGRLSQGFKNPPGTEEASATVPAIARWNKSKSEAEYLHLLKTDQWEVVIAEIVIRRGL